MLWYTGRENSSKFKLVRRSVTLDIVWFKDPNLPPKIAIAKYGIYLTEDSLNCLGYPEYVKFGFMGNSIVIGVADRDDENALLLNQNKDKKNRINNKNLIKEIQERYKLELNETLRLTGREEDGMLIFDF